MASLVEGIAEGEAARASGGFGFGEIGEIARAAIYFGEVIDQRLDRLHARVLA